MPYQPIVIQEETAGDGIMTLWHPQHGQIAVNLNGRSNYQAVTTEGGFIWVWPYGQPRETAFPAGWTTYRDLDVTFNSFQARTYDSTGFETLSIVEQYRQQIPRQLPNPPPEIAAQLPISVYRLHGLTYFRKHPREKIVVFPEYPTNVWAGGQLIRFYYQRPNCIWAVNGRGDFWQVPEVFVYRLEGFTSYAIKTDDMPSDWQSAWIVDPSQAKPCTAT